MKYENMLFFLVPHPVTRFSFLILDNYYGLGQFTNWKIPHGCNAEHFFFIIVIVIIIIIIITQFKGIIVQLIIYL